MNGNSSVALTRNVVITASKPVKKEDFVKKIAETAKSLVDYLKLNGCEKLGHIKFISTTNGEDYLQYSVIDMSQEPTTKGILRKTFDKIKLTLNIIEFGVGKDDIGRKVEREIKHMQEYFSRL